METFQRYCFRHFLKKYVLKVLTFIQKDKKCQNIPQISLLICTMLYQLIINYYNFS